MKKYSRFMRAAAVLFAAALIAAGCGQSSGSAGYDYKEEAMAEESAPTSAPSYGGTADYPAYSSTADEDYEAVSESAAADTYDAAGSAKNESGSTEPDTAASADAGSGAGAENGGLRQAENGEKIVYTANLGMETLEYEKSVGSLRQKITEAGGFIESEDESDSNSYWYYEDGGSGTRTLSITARIPSGKFYSFLQSIEGDGKIKSRSVNAQNITQVYSDTESVKKALEIEQQRLLDMMEKAETIEDMIAVEARLSEVERELNTYKTSLSGMDRDVQYSTVFISLREVVRYSPVAEKKSFITRLQEAFEDAIEDFRLFMENLALFVVGHFPFLIIAALIIILLVRASRRRKAKRAERIAAGLEPAPVQKPRRRFFRRHGAVQTPPPVQAPAADGSTPANAPGTPEGQSAEKE